MITTRHIHLELEFFRWLLLVLAAIAIVLATAVLAAAEPRFAPQLLPGDMQKFAKPLAVEPLQPFFPETPPAREFPPAEAAARLWAILDHQRAGRFTEAIAGWDQLRLPRTTAVWREVGLAVAYLHAGNVDEAARCLTRARVAAPDQPLVAYFQGVLLLERLAAVGRVPIEPLPQHLLLVDFTTPREERARYQQQAIEELQRALQLAPLLNVDERLLTGTPNMEEVIVVPRVQDLVAALGADNFVGKANHLLFGLHLDRGEFAAAEARLDLAVATGLAPLYGYRDLAEDLLEDGQNWAAARVILKDLQATNPWLAGLGVGK